MNESAKSEVEKSKAGKIPEPFNQPEPAFGWTAYAEQINGRFAMLGFVVLLLIEILTRQDLLTWLGLR